MGADLLQIHGVGELFEQAEAISSLPLRKLCFEGPAEDLSRTDISQPAIFTVSMAVLTAWRGLARAGGAPHADYFAGLSLGEYTALCAAGAFSFEDGVSLVTQRGRFMQEAAEARPSGMICLLGADDDVAARVCEKAAGDDVLVPANYNAPGQIVLSGDKTACARAEQLAAECGASGAVPLDVAGAFHSPFMQPAADRLADALSKTTIHGPSNPVLSNVTGAAHGSPDEIRAALVDQLTSPVRWQACCRFLLDRGASEFYELGPGRVLAGLMRRIDRKTRVTSLNGLAALNKQVEG